MYRITGILIDVENFLERGGTVLLIIFVVTLLLWMFIFERFIYLWTRYSRDQKKAVTAWKERPEKTSWYAKKIKALEINILNGKLNNSMSIIKTLIALCPLLGLLGTVTGMIEVFEIMAAVGTGNARAMASGISKATIPTMAGMVGALSGIYFNTRLERTIRKKRTKLEELMG